VRGKASKTVVRVDAKPVLSPRQNGEFGRQGEQERQVRAQPVQQPDRVARVGDPDVDVRRERRLAPASTRIDSPHPRGSAAGTRRSCRPPRRRVHAGDAGAEPVAGQRARELPAQPGQLGAASATRRWTPVVTSITAAWVSWVTRSRSSGPRPAMTLSERKASDQVARIEEHELLLDPDGEGAGRRVDRQADHAGRLVIVRGRGFATPCKSGRVPELCAGSLSLASS
jgi:hypothetical protein